MWVTFLYAPLIPIVVPFSLVNLIATYYVEKYTLLRRSSVKEILSKQVSLEMIELLEYIIIFYSIGIIIKLIIFFYFDSHFRSGLRLKIVLIIKNTKENHNNIKIFY